LVFLLALKNLLLKGEVIKFEGFLKVYLESNDDENDEDEETGILPSFAIGQNPNNISITATQKFSKPPGRFTEASLVKKLEELGIGRPSTFAPTISTIIDRGYVERGQREGQFRAYVQIVLKGNDISKNTLQETTGAVKGQLIPTDIGLLVNDFLTDQFKEVLNYSFTANIEKEFDTIASGNLEWGKMLAGFYKPFHEEVEKSINNKERVTGERALGTDPKTGKNMIARMGKFGPMIQIGDSEGDEKPTYAKLMPGQSIETITHEEAIKLFDLPRVVGVFEEKEIKANNGRFGPYVQHGSLFVSLKKGR
jgi:DNA topoisomerase-1